MPVIHECSPNRILVLHVVRRTVRVLVLYVVAYVVLHTLILYSTRYVRVPYLYGTRTNRSGIQYDCIRILVRTAY